MEMVSFLAGEEWSDMPQCASPVVSKFVQILNDRMGQDFRDKLQAYVPKLIGTASPAHDQERAEFLAWSAIKVFTPIALDAIGLHEKAQELRDFDKARGLRIAADAARAAADAADAAAFAAADAADAAHAAADAAARAVAFDVLDGLLKIGPSGEAYSQEHLDRMEPLRVAMGVSV